MPRLFGLIGKPLIHSWSPQYFKQKFRELHIPDCEYLLFPLDDAGELPVLVAKHPDLLGLNVTIPYKIQVQHYLDFLSLEASATGAVNTIQILRKPSNLIMKGYNTDVFGFGESITPLLQSHHKAALILGTGGAAQSAGYVFDSLGIEYIFVSRNPEKPNQLAYEQLSRIHFERCTILVNATPLGMFPDIAGYPPIPYQFISQHHLLFDMIYNPVETMFLQKGKQQGAKISNGLQMLHLQADKAWEIFTAAEIN